MTKEEMEAIREALAKATPGPWNFSHVLIEKHNQDGKFLKTIAATYGDYKLSNSNHEHDAFLIANAPTWLQQLLDENERLRNQLSDLCPIAELDVITTLQTEKAHMGEHIKQLQSDKAIAVNALKQIEQHSYSYRHLYVAQDINDMANVALGQIEGGKKE